jgi:hypothetical protein
LALMSNLSDNNRKQARNNNTLVPQHEKLGWVGGVEPTTSTHPAATAAFLGPAH